MGLARRRFGWGYKTIDRGAGGAPGALQAGARGVPAVIPGRAADPAKMFQGFKLRDLFRSRALGDSPGVGTPEPAGQPTFIKQLQALFTPGTRTGWWIPTNWPGGGRGRSIRKSEGKPTG